jgi:chorismate mutase/prephenate dehydratase
MSEPPPAKRTKPSNDNGEEIKDLGKLREEIDGVDHTLIELLNRRARISINIGKAKKLSNPTEEDEKTQVYIPGREKQVLEKVAKLNQGPLTDEAVQAIYREIMSASISLQKDVSIAYLGPPGTYSHQAAANRFGDSLNLTPMQTISDVFLAVEKGQALYGIVPFENSSFGSVVQCVDRLISTTVKIRAESYLEISHCLLSNSQKTSIKKIFSHPEALGQCRRWLENNMKGVELVNVSSTANAAKMASQEPNCGAICSEVCADLYELVLLEKGIQDEKGNTTRFFVIGDECDAPTGDDKTLIMFTVDHRKPGALCDALGVFKNENMNLTKIDSRPIPSRRWHYYFFIEFEGHYENPQVSKALKTLENYCIEVKVLGSYPNFLKKD